MVVSPILRGMFGLGVDAQTHTLTFAPHVPANWKSFSLDNLQVSGTTLALNYQRTPGTILIEVKRAGPGDCTIDFSPAISLRSDVVSVELNGRSLPFHLEPHATDQHISMRVPVTQTNSTVRVRLKNDFGINLENVLPALGSASEGLRVLAETWNPSRTQLTLSLSGLTGKAYEMSVWNSSQVTSVKGGKLEAAGPDQGKLVVEFPSATTESYVHQDLVLNFAVPK
jgi:hypothetical protein